MKYTPLPGFMGARTAYQAASFLFGPDEAMRLSLELARAIEKAKALDSHGTKYWMSVFFTTAEYVPSVKFSPVIKVRVGDGCSSFLFDTEPKDWFLVSSMVETIRAMAHEMFQPEAVPA